MIVSWMTTNRCNLNCRHCYQDAGEAKSEELSTEEAKNLIDGIARARFKIMIFSGGEALMRKDIFELVAYASAQGLRPVFGTNGTLITPQVAERLKSSGAKAMGISLESMDAEKHNAFRGDPTAYQRTMKGIENCRNAGLPFQIHMTIMDWNQDEVCDVIDFAESAGAMAVYLFFLVPVGRGIQIEGSILPVGEYEELLRRVMNKQKEVSLTIKPTCAPQFMRVAKELDVPVSRRFTRGCLAGLTYCIISPVGKVRPCAYMTEEAGDIRETPFDRIWKESELFKRLRTRAYGGSCASCGYADICGGCRARAAYAHDGDYMAEDSYCVCSDEPWEVM